MMQSNALISLFVRKLVMMGLVTCIKGTLIVGLGPRPLPAVDVEENHSCGKFSILRP